jgi:hypothetical protein
MPSQIYNNIAFSKISVSNSHSLGIIDGKIIGWGSPAKGKLDFPTGHNYTDISCGYSHSAAVTDDGSLVSVGNENDGKTNVDPLIWHKSVSCSRNYTASNAECESKDVIVVYGDQSPYSSLPSLLYRCVSKFIGVFNIPNAAHYDISDDGELIIITNTTEMFTISGSKRVLYESLPRPVVSLVRGSRGAVAIYLCDDGSAFRVTIDESGNPKRDHLGNEIISIFAGETYDGCANSKSLILNGEHFGLIELPNDDWQIKSVVGGNNGYAISVADKEGVLHTVLCGSNTKSKELVIGNKKSSECPRKKLSKRSPSDALVYCVREVQPEKIEVISATVTTLGSTDYECEPCGYRFISSQPKCPLCKCEVPVHV